MMPYIEVEINQEVKAMVEIAQVLAIRHASTVARATTEGTGLHTEKNAKNVAEKTTSNLFVEVVVIEMINVTPVMLGQRKATRTNAFMK